MLDFEALRDTLLAVSGKLDLKLGGLPVDIVSEPFPPRRTVYGLIDRQNLPGLVGFKQRRPTPIGKEQSQGRDVHRAVLQPVRRGRPRS